MRRLRTMAAGLLAGAVLLGLAVPAARAADGYAGPDPTYAGDGTLDRPTGESPMAVDAQDRLLLLERTGSVGARLVRFSAAGLPDPAFTPTELPQIRVHLSTVTVLDDGTISVVQAPSSPSVARTIVRVTPSGALESSYGTGGVLELSDVTAELPFLAQSDGTVVVATNFWGSLRFRRYDASGQLDPAFGDGGIVHVPCCGPEPEVPQAQSVQPDGAGGGLVVLIRHRQQQALVRIASDGTVGPELAVPVFGWATRLWAVPVGGFFLGFQAGPDDASGGGSVHLDDGLAADGGSALPGSAEVDPTSVRQVGDRVIVPVQLGSGRVALRAYTAAGLDETYGTAGSVVTESVQPGEDDHTAGPAAAVVAVAADGRALVAASWEWYPGFFNPYYQYATRIETYAPDGRRLSRTDGHSREAMHGAVAERVGSGFLLHSTTANPTGVFTPSDPKPRVRRIVPPREDAVLGPVRAAGAAIAGDQATVTWQPPAPTPGLVVSGYEVKHGVAGTLGFVATKETTATSAVLTLPTTAPLTAHRIQIRPKGIHGALGPVTVLVVIPGLPSVDAFLADLAARFGASATSDELAYTTVLLGDGWITAPEVVSATARTAAWQQAVDPVVRLYLSYFQRPPDPSGLRHWTAKRRTGTSVARIAAVFADSSEFRRTYGSLSNRAFVELVYANVLGRPADASGLAYWTGRLDRRATSRGHLMASFSESSEHVRRTRATVDVVSIHWGLLGRTPTKAELVRWAGPTPEGDADALALALLQTEEYLARFD